eukprot:TRINITY_DN11107_c0_g1_i1.p1 TRINITY_DN11107_c0_g1~~TRINITY_DN11107_c0_g1_i1.p1  ORF type:complete len:463 (+),score=101.17 TRINITY_DN11107_c0_g1_i1:28-1389(+)
MSDRLASKQRFTVKSDNQISHKSRESDFDKRRRDGEIPDVKEPVKRRRLKVKVKTGKVKGVSEGEMVDNILQASVVDDEMDVVDDVEVDTDPLPLPKAWKVVEELFLAIETVFGREKRKIVPFFKLRESVELISRRKLTIDRLEKIAYVAKKCYIFTINQIENDDGVSEELCIQSTAYLPDDPSEVSENIRYRRTRFSEKLYNQLKRKHKYFVSKMKPKPADHIIEKAGDPDTWHPSFPLETMKIKNFPIPKVEKKSNTFITSEQVEEKLIGEHHPEMLKRKKYKETLDLIKSGQDNELSQTLMEENIPSGLEMVDRSTIAAARLREKINQQNTSEEYIAIQNKIMMLSRLPKICDIVFWYYFSNSKTIYPLSTIVEHIAYSMPNLVKKKGEVERHLDLFLSECPGSFKIMEINDTSYLKALTKDPVLHKEWKAHLEQTYQNEVESRNTNFTL